MYFGLYIILRINKVFGFREVPHSNMGLSTTPTTNIFYVSASMALLYIPATHHLRFFFYREYT